MKPPFHRPRISSAKQRDRQERERLYGLVDKVLDDPRPFSMRKIGQFENMMCDSATALMKAVIAAGIARARKRATQ